MPLPSSKYQQLLNNSFLLTHAPRSLSLSLSIYKLHAMLMELFNTFGSVFWLWQKMGVNSNRVEDFSSQETTLRITTESIVPGMEIHNVCLPPKKTTLQKLKQRLGEIFFPDDPLYRFKNQTWCKKLLLGLQFLFPIFQWGPEYSLRLLRSDIISGLTIASLAIPQVRTSIHCTCITIFTIFVQAHTKWSHFLRNKHKNLFMIMISFCYQRKMNCAIYIYGNIYTCIYVYLWTYVSTHVLC